MVNFSATNFLKIFLFFGLMCAIGIITRIERNERRRYELEERNDQVKLSMTEFQFMRNDQFQLDLFCSATILA